MKKYLLQFRILFTRQDLLRFGILILLLISIGLLELISMSAVPLYMGMLIGELEKSGLFQKLPFFLRRICSSIPLFSILFVLLYIFRAAYLNAIYHIQYHILGNRKIALTSRLYRDILYSPYNIILQYPHPVLFQNLIEHPINITFNVLSSVFTLGRCLFLTLLTTILILTYNFTLSCIAITILTCTCGIYMIWRSKKLKKIGQDINDSHQDSINIVSETLTAIPETQIYHLQELFSQKLHKSQEKSSKAESDFYVDTMMLWPNLEVMTLFSLVSTMLITMQFQHSTPLELAPSLTLLTIALTRIKSFYSDTMISLNHLIANQKQLEQVTSLLTDLEKNMPHSEQKTQDTPFRELKLDQVGYTYQKNEQKTLQNISFTLKKGQSMGIVGPTGCGKSTLLNIILGLLPPEQGKITVNRQDMDMQLDSWQRKIGYVPQTIAVFDDTIEHNITLTSAKEEIDRERLMQAVEAAQLEDCLAKKTEGLKTVIGDQGRELSGGERQRIGIARALYRNPEILILDEATSALDGETEKAIVRTIGRLKGSLTMIIVAHRLSTLEQCDFLYDFRNQPFR